MCALAPPAILEKSPASPGFFYFGITVLLYPDGNSQVVRNIFYLAAERCL
jgi:hypothetical protein